MEEIIKEINASLASLAEMGIRKVNLFVECKNNSSAGNFSKTLIEGVDFKPIIIKDKENFNNPLSEREMEVLTLLVEGKSNTEIAEKLIVSPTTAKAHVTHILQKFNVNDRTQAAVKAVRLGLA